MTKAALGMTKTALGMTKAALGMTKAALGMTNWVLLERVRLYRALGPSAWESGASRPQADPHWPSPAGQVGRGGDILLPNPTWRVNIVEHFVNCATMRQKDWDYFDRFLHSLRSVEMTG